MVFLRIVVEYLRLMKLNERPVREIYAISTMRTRKGCPIKSNEFNFAIKHSHYLKIRAHNLILYKVSTYKLFRSN